MPSIDLARIKEHYAHLDRASLEADLTRGPEGFAHPGVWDILVTEATQRGIDVQSVQPASLAGPVTSHNPQLPQPRSLSRRRTTVGYGAFLFAALTILVFIVLSLLLGPEADANAGAVAFLIGVPLTLLILGALLVGTVASISGRVPRPLQCLGGAAVVYVGIMVTELISASIVTPLFLLPTLGLSVDWFLRGRKRLVDH